MCGFRGGLYNGETGVPLYRPIVQGPAPMPKVKFIKEKKEIEVPEGANLREEAMKAGIQVYPGVNKYLNCFGNATCGTCKVLIKKGMENTGPKSFMEKVTLFRMFSAIGHENEMRLSCQTRVNGDIEVETQPDFNLSGDNFWQKPYPNK
jgi:ferredoxin